METLHKQGYEIFVEVGPKPTLLAMGQQCLAEGKQIWLPSLRQGHSDWQQLLHSLGALYVRGVAIDWRGFDRDYARRRVSLPTYPFQRERYWIPDPCQKTAWAPKAAGHLSLHSRNTLPRPITESEQDWLYEIEWQPKAGLSRLPPTYLPTPEILASQLLPQMIQFMSPAELTAHDEVLNQLESLSTTYVVNALRNMGWPFDALKRFSTDSIANELGVVNRHRRFLSRLLDILAEEGALRQLDSDWEVAFIPEIQDSHEQLRVLLGRYPIAEAELTLIGRCGSKLAEVLHGQCDPLTLLFPEGDSITAARLYQDSPGAQAANTLVQKALLSCLERLPQNRRARILEIGAGTGGTTSYLLPHLDSQRTEYVFTDISRAFTARAQEKFGHYPFVRYELLDMEQEPLAQGFGSHQYDLILAANVLHATKDLRQSLHHVQQLLAPGGMLILVEGTAPLRFIDLIFGQTEGWWRFADQELRPFHPLLSAARWQQLLYETGFKQAVTVSSNPEEGGIFAKQALIIAQAAELNPDIAEKGRDHWLVFADSRGIGQHLSMHLESRADVCSLVFRGNNYQQVAERKFRIDPTNPADFQRLLDQITRADYPPLRGVVNLWGLETLRAEALTSADLEAASQICCRSALYLVQSLGKLRLPDPPSLWLVTRGAQPAGSDGEVPGVAQSPLWGMAKAISLEHPELRCVRVDLDPANESAEVQAQTLFEEIWSGSGEDQIAFRSQVRYVARLVRHSGRATEVGERLPFRAYGTYLITGGLGGLGLLMASWLVEQGVRSLVLVGRSGANEAARTQLESLEQAGATVMVAQADVSDEGQVKQLLTAIDASLPPLRGIIHAAGVLDDGVLLQQTWDRFSRVIAPKVMGTWNLHTLTQNRPLDFFVLFSSTASLLGSPGQANHAAANAFLDALAHHRRALGLPGLSINWGAWSEIGSAAAGQVSERAKMMGMGTITPRRGLRSFERLFSQPWAQIGVVPIAWPTFIQQFQTGGDPPFLAELAGEARERLKGDQQTAKQGDFLSQWSATAPEERHSCVDAYIRRQVAKVLRLSPAELKIEVPLNCMGFDSLMAIELKNRIKIDSGVDVPLVKFMEDFSVISLTAEMNGQLAEAHSSPSTAIPGLGEQRPSTIDFKKGVSPQEAKRILAQLDQLTDDEVDTLLTFALGESEG